MELVGVHPTCSLMKTQSLFEEAHHWNIQAKFYSVKGPHIVICMHDDLYGVQGIKDKVLVWISQKEQQCAPSLSFFFLFLFFLFFCIFWWPRWLFLFNSHLSSLVSFNFSSLGSFPHLRATSYILQEYRISSHFTRSTQHKE